MYADIISPSMKMLLQPLGVSHKIHLLFTHSFHLSSFSQLQPALMGLWKADSSYGMIEGDLQESE